MVEETSPGAPKILQVTPWPDAMRSRELAMFWWAKHRETWWNLTILWYQWIVYLILFQPISSYFSQSQPISTISISAMSLTSLGSGPSPPEHVDVDHQLGHDIPHPGHAIHEMGLRPSRGPKNWDLAVVNLGISMNWVYPHMEYDQKLLPKNGKRDRLI